jgi:hypothetical protein
MELTTDATKILAYNLDRRSLQSLKSTSKSTSNLINEALDSLAYKSMTESMLDIPTLPNYENVSWEYIYNYFSTKDLNMRSRNPVIVDISLLAGDTVTDDVITNACRKGYLESLKVILARTHYILTDTLQEDMIEASINSGDVPTLAFVLNNATIDTEDPIIDNLFYHGGNLQMVIYLIDSEYITYQSIDDYISDDPYDGIAVLSREVMDYLVTTPGFIEEMDLYILLLLAIQHNYEALALELIDNPDVDINNGDSWPLQQAIVYDKPSIVSKLLNSDRFDISEEDYETCLYKASDISPMIHSLIENYGRDKVFLPRV